MRWVSGVSRDSRTMWGGFIVLQGLVGAKTGDAVMREVKAETKDLE